MEQQQPPETASSSSAEGEEPKAASLFPLFGVSAANLNQTSVTAAPAQWLSNTSFTTDLSVVNDAVSALYDRKEHQESSDEEPEPPSAQHKPLSSTSYELIGEEEEGRRVSSSDSDGRRRKEHKRHKKRKRSKERGKDTIDGLGSRKSNVRAWADSDTKPAKDFYFDTRGDPDNLVFGGLYRMDVARYKSYNLGEAPWFDFNGLYGGRPRGSVMDRDVDIDALDSKVKSGGRYWSAKYAALERHKNFKRVRVHAPRKSAPILSDDFIPLLDYQISGQGVDDGSALGNSVIEESWEDEVLRKTREFNRLTREHPHDEKGWLDFADFQEKVASMQPQKGARLQTLEKKISILEKASELNPDNEELLLCLLKAYQQRDNTDMLIGRWEQVLLRHSGNLKLWSEFLRVVQGEFSRFKVSEMRKMYAHAIQALSAACSKQFRQVHQTANPSTDPAILQLELGLVDIFSSLCRFEWQAGYRELATALFQAEMEFGLFCPSLLLTEQSKQRLFEHFWSSDGARVGEEGALGWSLWLEKEEEDRQRIIKEESSREDLKGGWSGWSEPHSKLKEDIENSEKVMSSDLAADEEYQEDTENEELTQEDDTEALLKQLGIDVDAGAGSEINDSSTWTRWAEEEFSRDGGQWMPVRAGISQIDGTPESEVDEQISRVIVYEDVCEYLFSLSSEEARLSLVLQFVEFFGGKLCQWICTNSSSWTEKILGLEELPDFMLQKLRRVHEVLVKSESNGMSLEFLLSSGADISWRSDMMRFLRNAILLSLTAFQHNHMLDEAALVAEELSVTKMNSCACSVTPSRALAKRLLKSDRQNILLCGVYAQREAVFGNIDHARRVFDMALASIEGLPVELRSDAPLLYFWYAEAELSDDHGSSTESKFRVIHILSCLGSGTPYSPFKCQSSSLQLLRAHQGFKERLKTIRSAWARGDINDQSIAFICSAALFEELTAGWAAGIEVLDQTFTMVLPERRSYSHRLEFLFNYHVRMLLRHRKQLSLSKVWEFILQGLQIYPSSPELFSATVEFGHLYTTPNKVRWVFDDYCNKKPSVIVWLFALSFEMSRGSSQHRIRGLFERALGNESLHNSVLLWRCYIAYEINIMCNPAAARRIFFRAIHACPWSKTLWLDGFLKLNSVLTAKELSDLQEVMRDKELNLRTDIYEILLQDEIVT
ncbi:nuclear exosome regulator NRDE2 isoform X2 [Tripterygium wilfordii]|uniref:nuclear exosome regulator NRDE2 isoform X2 n=1 Tax=Tripterygium wilfordii TaxID=458696 RepID=UPI0018F80A04|nr:nuclear exosome regulator NRDE2 isoform X2 [Tripterygium wilfordii]